MGSSSRDVVSLDRGDETLSVRVRSGSPTVLFLHGLAGHGGEWGGVAHFLPEEFGLIMPDQRGHGLSFSGSSTDVSSDRWVEDAVACIESFADAPVTVVGQSMGSIVAVQLAAQRPELVENLILIEAGMQAMTEENLAGLADWFGAWPKKFATRGAAREFFGAEERSSKAWVDGLEPVDGGFRARFHAETMLETMRQLGGTDRSNEWKRTVASTVVMQATESVIDSDDVAAMVAARPEIELVTIAGGHDLHLDEPEIVAGVISRAVGSRPDSD